MVCDSCCLKYNLITSWLFCYEVWLISIKVLFSRYSHKICKVCHFSVLPTGGEFLGFSPTEPVTVVLEDDGTIVQDEGYFWCLPLNTKFMLLHEKETWSPLRKSKQVFWHLSTVLTDSYYLTWNARPCVLLIYFSFQWTVVQPGWPGILWCWRPILWTPPVLLHPGGTCLSSWSRTSPASSSCLRQTYRYQHYSSVSPTVFAVMSSPAYTGKKTIR